MEAISDTDCKFQQKSDVNYSISVHTVQNSGLLLDTVVKERENAVVKSLSHAYRRGVLLLYRKIHSRWHWQLGQSKVVS